MKNLPTFSRRLPGAGPGEPARAGVEDARRSRAVDFVRVLVRLGAGHPRSGHPLGGHPCREAGPLDVALEVVRGEKHAKFGAASDRRVRRQSPQVRLQTRHPRANERVVRGGEGRLLRPGRHEVPAVGMRETICEGDEIAESTPHRRVLDDVLWKIARRVNLVRHHAFAERRPRARGDLRVADRHEQVSVRSTLHARRPVAVRGSHLGRFAGRRTPAAAGPAAESATVVIIRRARGRTGSSRGVRPRRWKPTTLEVHDCTSSSPRTRVAARGGRRSSSPSRNCPSARGREPEREPERGPERGRSRSWDRGRSWDSGWSWSWNRVQWRDGRRRGRGRWCRRRLGGRAERSQVGDWRERRGRIDRRGRERRGWRGGGGGGGEGIVRDIHLVHGIGQVSINAQGVERVGLIRRIGEDGRDVVSAAWTEHFVDATRSRGGEGTRGEGTRGDRASFSGTRAGTRAHLLVVLRGREGLSPPKEVSMSLAPAAPWKESAPEVDAERSSDPKGLSPLMARARIPRGTPSRL